MDNFTDSILSIIRDDVWQYAVVPFDKVCFEQEVLDACARNACGRYGKSWTCPPGNGDPVIIRNRLQAYKNVFVFTTKHELEDSFDYEGMLTAHKKHDDVTKKLVDFCKENGAKLLGAGSCSLCEKCTYPDAPCRFPEDAIASVESCGINVMALAKTGGINYINGSDTVTYFTAIFFN